MCNDGNVEYGRLQCWSGEYNKQPYAYPHVLSLAYRVFGVRQGVAFAVNAVAMAAARPCVLYLLVSPLRRPDRGLLRGAAVALTPQQASVVGDGGRRAHGVAGVRRGAARCGAVSAHRKHAGARRRRVASGVCGPVPARVAADPACRGGCCCGSIAATIARARDSGGWRCSDSRCWPCTWHTCSRCATRAGAPAMRVCRCDTLPRTCASTARSTSPTSGFPFSSRLCAGRAARRLASGSPCGRLVVYFLGFFGIVPAVLRRQLQLRR